MPIRRLRATGGLIAAVVLAAGCDSSPTQHGGVPPGPPPSAQFPVITTGQTIVGTIDVGTVADEYRIVGRAGDEWVVFVQSPAPSAYLKILLVDSATSDVLAGAGTNPEGTSTIEERSTGRVVLPHDGTYLVRATSGDFVPNQGGYRFRVAAINRAPEGNAAGQSAGAIVVETIGSVADVDEYTLAARAGEAISVMARIQSGLSDSLKVEVRHGAEVLASADIPPGTAALDDAGTGRVVLPADGQYTVRVSGAAWGTASSATGSYQLEIYPVDRRPEAGAQLRLDGPPVVDAVDRPGDVDEYPFTARAGQLAVVRLAPTGPTRGLLSTEIVGPDGTILATAYARSQTGTGYTLRTTLPVDGIYTVRVDTPPDRPLAFGRYAVEVYSIDPGPEHVPAHIRIGQTVTGEAIDRPGDLDVFTVDGDPSRQVNFFLGAPDSAGNLLAGIRRADEPAYPAWTWLFTLAGSLSLDGLSTGRFTMDPTPYTITVDINYSSTPAVTGPYALRFFPIDPRPEGRSGIYTPGDTVSGEPIYPAGDIDTYTFALSTPTRFHILWDGEAPGILYDSAGEQPWNSIMTDNDGIVREITLPAGTYTLRVLAPFADAPRGVADPTLPYRFAFVPE